MSNSGVNEGFAKCFICFMALIILLQGAVYLGLSIWGITLKECTKTTTDITEKPFQFAMDLVYFLDEDCGEPSISVSNKVDPATINVNWGESDSVTNRTYIIMIAYAAISALWIVTSLLVIATICGPVTKVVKALCFWPWFLAIIAGSILDAVATGYHINDIIHTTSVEKTFEYLGLSTSQAAMEILQNFDAYFITPSVIMTCISSRIALIWLLNIFGSSFCLSLSNVMSNRNSSTKSSVTSAATTVTAPVTTSQLQQPTPQEQFYAQEIAHHARSASPQPQEPPQIRPKPLIIQSATSVQRQSSIPPSDNNDYIRQYDVQSPTAPSPNVPSPSSNVVTYRNTETHPDRLNYPPQQQQQQQNQRSMQAQQSHDSFSPISPLNNRYSTSDGFAHAQQQNQRVSEELRGQLPWSYTSIPPPIPKKPQMQVYPEIPEPDYGN